MAQDQWYAVYEAATGRLVSEGTVVANPLPPGLVLKIVPKPDDSAMWNQSSLDFVPRPAIVMVDRVVDFSEDPTIKSIFLKLPLEDRQALRSALAVLLGRRRFRFADQAKELG